RSLPDPARAALVAGTLGTALFFSAETARTAVRLVRRARLEDAIRTVEAVAIGKPAAVALQDLPWRRIRTAARPNQDPMLALLRCPITPKPRLRKPAKKPRRQTGIRWPHGCTGRDSWCSQWRSSGSGSVRRASPILWPNGGLRSRLASHSW